MLINMLQIQNLYVFLYDINVLLHQKKLRLLFAVILKYFKLIYDIIFILLIKIPGST